MNCWRTLSTVRNWNNPSWSARYLPTVLGKTVAQYLGESYVKNGVLYVHIRSAALRSQLFDIRFELLRKLNEAAGAKVLKDIRLLG